MRGLIVILLLATLCAGGQSKKTIKFERIVFNTDECFGRCPVYQLQIDSNHQAKLLAHVVYKEKINWAEDVYANADTAKIGWFAGKIEDSTFNELTQIIQPIDSNYAIPLDSIIDCSDCAVAKTIVY